MIQWTDTPVDVRTLCSQPLNGFPILARFPAAEDASKPSPTGEGVQGQEGRSSRPPPVSYLLYSVRNCIKVSGTSLRWDDVEKTLKNDGIDYVIPLNYPGWFRVLSGDLQPAPPPSLIVPLTSIEQVVASRSNRFLVHSSVTGLWPDRSPSMTTTSKRESFLDVQVPPGEVLTCGPIFVEPQDDRLKRRLPCCLCPSSSFGKKKAEGQQQQQQSGKMYLQCRGTTTGIDILLPLETYGQFSCVGTSQSNLDEGPTTTSTPPTVYQIKDLVDRKDFPQRVQLVHGTPPPSEDQTKQSFTGLMVLGQTYSEQSIIACQITRDGRQLAFVEFPDDSGVEFLLAKDWEGDDSLRKAIDFCQQHSAWHELEIQPIIGSNRLHGIAIDKTCKHSADVLRSGTFSKRTSDNRAQPVSVNSEGSTDPASQQKPTERIIQPSGEAVPTIPQRRTKTPTGFQRRQANPHHPPQTTTTIPLPTPRPRSAHNSWHRVAKSLDITTWSEKADRTDTKSPQTVQDSAVPAPNSPDNGRCGPTVNHTPARFTKSLEKRHQLNNQTIALVHRPRTSRNLPRPRSEHDHNVTQKNTTTRHSSGRITDRKLPPLPSQTEAIKNVEETNDGFEVSSSSEVESNSSDPDRLYERIPCQKEISNEPSASAPSSPAPTIRHRQEIPQTTVSPLAYDQDGYLTPVELRDTGRVLEKGRDRISFNGSLGSAGNCKKKLGQNYFYSSHRRYITSPADRIHFDRRFDSDRLQSFLDDSVAELHRKQLHRKDSENTTDSYGRDQRLYQRNNNPFDNTSRKRPRPLSAPDFPNLDFPRDDSDSNLKTILDCEDGEIDNEEVEEEGYPPRFLHRVSSSSLRMRRLNPAAIASYHGMESAAFSDSGIASRQSTMRKENYWKAIDVLWTPPEDLSSLTVEEVAMSLRYIGMKDQTAVSFSKEQVDGKLLCEMNSHLLKEGFPNMNSLERKKVLDFVHGWRPKRLLFI